MTNFPHDDYAEAVASALAATGYEPTHMDTWAEEGYGPDGEPIVVLVIVARWDDGAPDGRTTHNTARWPHGLTVMWHSDTAWEWAPNTPRRGETRTAEFLPVDRVAAPESLAAAVTALMTGAARPASTDRWAHADSLAAYTR